METDHGSVSASRVETPSEAASVLMLLANGFHPDPRVHREATSLIEGGFSVTVLCLDRDCDLPTSEEIDGVEVHRVRVGEVRPGEYLSVSRALALFGVLGAREARSLNRKKTFDLIHCNDFDTIAMGLLLGRLWRVPVVYDIHDLYSSFFCGGLPGVLVQKIDDVFYRAADAMLIVNEEFRTLPGLQGKDVTVIMNVPGKEGAGIREDDDEGLFYAGNLNLLRDMRWALPVFEESGFPVVFAGDGPLRTEYEKMARGRGVELLGRIPPQEVYERTGRCRAVLALYDTSYPNNRFASPNKLFDAMKFGKPAVVSSGTVMARIVEEAECGLVVPYGDAGALTAALRTLRDDEAYGRMCENAHRAHRERFNWEIMADRLVALYRSLTEKRKERDR